MDKYIIRDLETPYYIVDERLLLKNLEILKRVQDESGAKVLLAQKCFSMYSTYPLISKYLSGTTSSGLFELKLAAEEFGKEKHVFSAAYLPSEINEIIDLADHIGFNSIAEFKKYAYIAKDKGKEVSIRINPKVSTQDSDIYNPCRLGSHLGVSIEKFDESILDILDGIHFHTLCEQGFEALDETLKVVERDFNKYFKNIKWINFGGGHHITKENYDVDALIERIKEFKNKYSIDVYLEPGEAVAVDSGFLVSRILDVVENDGIKNLVIDASAACHMPDVLEMPYRPEIYSAFKPGVKKFTYTLVSHTCLAGDIIGSYSFDKEMSVGDYIILCDMAIYSMVKNNTFNGMQLPSIVRYDLDGQFLVVKKFGYNDFKVRL